MKTSEVPVSLRSKDGERAYQYDKKNGHTKGFDASPSLWGGVFWRIISNDYSPDGRFKPARSRMLIPRRKFPNWWNMYPWEAVEYLIILYRHRLDGSQQTLNLGKTRSVPDRYHLHFNEFYDSRKDFKE